MNNLLELIVEKLGDGVEALIGTFERSLDEAGIMLPNGTDPRTLAMTEILKYIAGHLNVARKPVPPPRTLKEILLEGKK